MDYISADVEAAGQPAWAPDVAGEGPAKEGPHLPGDLLTLTPPGGRAVTCALGISVTCALWVTCALGIKNLGHLRTYLLPSNGWCLLHMQLVNGLGWGVGGGVGGWGGGCSCQPYKGTLNC